MRSTSFLYFLSVLFLIPTALGIPVTTRPRSPTPTYAKGDYVGVRPTAYETKDPSHKKISIHPGIIVGDPHPDTGAHPVAMISKTPPFNPPQAPIEHFQTGTGIYGNVVLKARPISPGAMKPWKNGKSGEKQTPLAGQGYQKLVKAMEPHVNWKPPTPPPRAPTPPEVQRQKQKQREAALAYAKGQRQPPHPNQHSNAHASSSRTPHQGTNGGHGPWRSPNPGPSHPHSQRPPTHQGTGHNVHTGGHNAPQGHGRHPPSHGGNGGNRAPNHPQGHGGGSGYRAPNSGHQQSQQGHGGSGSRRPPSPGSNARHPNTNRPRY